MLARARERLPPGDGRGDPSGVRRRAADRSVRSVSMSRFSPTRLCGMASTSRERTATAGTCSVSRPDATTSRASPTSARRARATRCPNCGGALRFQTAIEVGHIFKFGYALLEPLDATFLDEDGVERPLIGGSYGVGPGARHGGGRRAVARRERDRLAGLDRSVRRSRARPARWGRGACSRGGETSPRSLSRRASTCSSTTATSAPERSSPTRISSGCPLRVIVGKKTLDDGSVDVRRRDGSRRGPRRRSADVLKWAQDA